MFITRQKREEIEAQALASYGLKSAASKGREYPEDEPEHRTAFQRDRDRILHTTAFRRLEYKTQVLVNYEGDYYRTRLTHTLEVTQIGRTLARAMGGNEDLVEGICLGHDLGHPPFGHSGEHVLNTLMKDHGGFEHNKQSYRILTELEKRYPKWNGLNLTYELREGIIKHETEYDKADVQGFSPDLRASLEAQIANVADELAYNGHDLDDGLRGGLIVPGQLEEVELWRVMCDKIGLKGDELSELDRHRLIRGLIGFQIEDVLEQTRKNLVEAGVKTPEDIQKLDHNVVAHSQEVGNLNRELKNFLYSKLYRHYRVVRMSVKAERFIQALFEAYTNEPQQLHPHIYSRIDSIGLHRAVTDYIAGMTDRYALQEWERLFGPFVRP